MAAFATLRARWSPGQILTALVRLALLALPACLLAAIAQRSPEDQSLILWFGAAFQAIVGWLTLSSRRAWQQSVGPIVITLYLTALSWLWFGDSVDDWLNHFSKAVLVVIPILVFGYQSLLEAGALVLRRPGSRSPPPPPIRRPPAALSSRRNRPRAPSTCPPPRARPAA